MKCAVVYSLVCGLAASSAQSQDLTDPMEILKRADAAAKRINVVRYTIVSQPTGWIVSRSPRVEASVVQERDGSATPKRFRIRLEAKMPGSGDSLSFTGGGDGQVFYLIDPREKKVYVDSTRKVLGVRERMLHAVGMVEFVHPTPYADEMKASKRELKGVVDVEGEACYAIHIEYAGGPRQAVWYFSTKDFLPRRRDQILSERDGKKASIVLTIKTLAVNPSFIADPFKLVVPTGYTRTKDVAP
jgi:hypothetical protein